MQSSAPICAAQFQPVSFRRSFEELRIRVGSRAYQSLASNKRDRDGEGYHMTVVDPVELNDPPFDGMLPEFGRKPVECELAGLGCARNARSEAWFIVVRSPAAQMLRTQWGASIKDFHITLGFDPEDVHDQPKDESSIC